MKKPKGSLRDVLLENTDEKILEIYSILEKDYSEVLYRENFDVSKEKLDYYTQRHCEIYSKKSEEIFENFPRCLILSSGMFGGKTTLSFLLCEKFEREGKRVEMLIADVVGEDYITARSYRGSQKKSAKRFGHLTEYKKTIENLSESEVDVILLDEFSFLDVKIIEDLQEMCFANDKKLILTGLSSSYLGKLLPAFEEGSKILKNAQIEECFSFVPGFCEQEPLGRNTVRYLRINNNWVLDFGLLPLVISKEKTHIVHYTPAMYEHTAVSILKGNEELLDSILCPSKKMVLKQNLLFGKLERQSFPSSRERNV